jgi:GNAT superfamily N-acetyltransferase
VEIINLKNRENYLRQYIELCSKQWGTKCYDNQLKNKVDKKLEEILSNKNDKLIVALGLINDNNLVGFISLFKTDGNERTDLTPWYGTMYVKEEFRNKGYSKILNNAILEEAKRLGYNKVYLKTDLTNYYEKFGAKFIEKLYNGEKLYYIEIQ